MEAYREGIAFTGLDRWQFGDDFSGRAFSGLDADEFLVSRVGHVWLGRCGVRVPDDCRVRVGTGDRVFDFVRMIDQQQQFGPTSVNAIDFRREANVSLLSIAGVGQLVAVFGAGQSFYTSRPGCHFQVRVERATPLERFLTNVEGGQLDA